MAPRASAVPQSLRSFGRHTGEASPSRTDQIGIFGTDLGSSFEHAGKLWFIFGDTWPEPQKAPTDNRDSVAWSLYDHPDDGILLNFPLDENKRYKSPILLDEGGKALSVGAYEVPIAGVSALGRMFVFYSTGTFDEVCVDGGLDAFWVGRDGAVGANWANPGIDATTWHDPSAPTPPLAVRPGSPATAATRLQGAADLFWFGPDGAVATPFSATSETRRASSSRSVASRSVVLRPHRDSSVTSTASSLRRCASANTFRRSARSCRT